MKLQIWCLLFITEAQKSVRDSQLGTVLKQTDKGFLDYFDLKGMA